MLVVASLEYAAGAVQFPTSVIRAVSCRAYVDSLHRTKKSLPRVAQNDR